VAITDIGITDSAAADLSEEDFDTLGYLVVAILEDLDSCDLPTIACCDACFDKFTSTWPLARLGASGLEEQSMGFDMFYQWAGRVQGVVSKAEFDRLMQYVACPYCSRSIGPNIYAFELPFDGAKELETTISRLGALATRTPFLLFSDPFAVQVRKEIEKRSASLSPCAVECNWYRGRSKAIEESSGVDFGPPPKALTREGRYNHAGRPVVYLADAPATCWEECRRPPCAFSIARFSFVQPLRIVDLSDPGELDEVLAAMLFSSLMSAPSNNEGWDRPEYTITRFVADCARFASVDAIQYPSTRFRDGRNLVILDGDRFGSLAILEEILPFSSTRSRSMK
jgi:RES domain-containing protein